MQSAQAFAQDLHSACLDSCLRHSFSQSSATLMQSCTIALRWRESYAASLVSALQVASISCTESAHPASEVSPVLNCSMQCWLQASPVLIHAMALSMRRVRVLSMT